MPEAYRTSSAAAAWKPSPVVALSTSPDNTRVAAAREDGSLELWLVSPGSVGWHCQLTIHGDPKSRISSLVWLSSGRLFSSSIDGSVSEWDLYNLKQKIVIESIGASIWQMSVSPSNSPLLVKEDKPQHVENGYLDDEEKSEVEDDDGDTSEDDSDSIELHEHPVKQSERLAIACDDGCIRVYTLSDSYELVYTRSLPRVSGRVLSVAWSPDASLIYSGTSDGFIRCWDAKTFYEVYRITVGLGGLGSGSELCVWSLLALRSGALVSADSTGSVQFWDSQHGTLLQAHTRHKGDVNALAAAPNHNGVFSAGSDGKVILYKLSSEKVESADDKLSELIKKWVYVDHVRAHTHDVRALTIAVPISREDPLPDEKFKRVRRKEKPIDFSYRKWAHMGVPMLISAGDDTKLFAFSVQEFTKFAPHDISPAPQRLPMHLVQKSVFNQKALLLVQAPHWLDILSVNTESGAFGATASGPSGGLASTELLARVKAKASRKIVCSAISSSGAHIAYSDHSKLSLVELDKLEGGKGAWSVKKKPLPQKLPSAHCMIFTSDSARLILAGHDRKIYVVDVGTSEILHTFKPYRKESASGLPPDEPPITRLFTSCDGQWLAAVNCFGDVYVYNLDIQRQHWFISRLDGASVTAGGFSPSNRPKNINVLVLTTSSNQVYVFDVEAKQLGEWSSQNTFKLPRRFQEFPGEVIGLSFPPPSCSSNVVIFSSRSMCVIDFGLPVDHVEENGGLMQDTDLALTRLLRASMNGNGKLKRNLDTTRLSITCRKNFEFFAFRDPVLFVGHLSNGSVLMVDRPWMDVVKSMESAPVHRHIFGT